MRTAGERLEQMCNNVMHGRWVPFARDEHDPNCPTCTARGILSEHDHLHLDGKPCADGDMVKCKCGSYHH